MFRVLFHLLIVRFFLNFFGFVFKLIFAGLIVIVLQVVVGEKSLEEHLEIFLKQSSLTHFVKRKWSKYTSPGNQIRQPYQPQETEELIDENMPSP